MTRSFFSKRASRSLYGHFFAFGGFSHRIKEFVAQRGDHLGIVQVFAAVESCTAFRPDSEVPSDRLSFTSSAAGGVEFEPDVGDALFHGLSHGGEIWPLPFAGCLAIP